MSLQFIFGNSGSGKSRCLYESIVRQSIRDPGRNYFVIVPEQFTMQTQKDLCMEHPSGGIMNIDVVSFGRLAHRVFEESGRDVRPVLDDEGKTLVLRRIAGGLEDELTVLRGNLKKQGYISEVKSVISEFTQYGVEPRTLEQFLSGLDPAGSLYLKLDDIRKIYEGFEEYLRERYITKEEMLDVLSTMVPGSELLKDSVVAVDGFTGFTPVQDRLIGELLKVCKKVMITVEMDQREDPFVFRHPYQLFALGKEMASSLAEIAAREGVEMEEPVFLKGTPVYRFRNNPELAFLESELFRYSGKQYPADGEGEYRSISLHEAGNPKGEAVFAAETIRRLVREKGYRYRDIAVIASDMNTYADAAERAFRMYDIPFFTDHKKSILFNSFVEYLRSLLDMAEQNFTYDSVFRHLRTGLCGFTDDEIDRMENYCLALGIRGYKKWQQAWVRKTSESAEEMAELNRLRERFSAYIEPLFRVLRKRNKTVREVTGAVYEHLCREKLQEQLNRMQTEFQDAGELAAAKEYAQVYRIAVELFDKFTELLGDEKVSLKEYCDLLDAGLEEAKVAVVPPSLDQVMIGDIERTRIKNIKALFFLGANDTLLPGSMSGGGLLSERDRECFQKEHIALSPGAKEKLYIQKFYLYLNLTKPEDRLFLCWSRVSGNGKTLRPAYPVQEIRRLFPGIPCTDEGRKELPEREFTPRTGAAELAAGLRDRQYGVSEAWKDLYTWYVRFDPERAEQVRKAAFLKYESPVLGAERAEKLYPDPSRISVTRLEQFASCAYAHFLNYGLRLTERQEYGFEAMDLGNIAHQALERFSGKAEKAQTKWQDLEPEVRDRMIWESVDESVIDYGNTVLFSTARNEYMISRIRQLIGRSVWALTRQMEKGDFLPGGYEMKFGAGKIDRIDTCEDGDCIYVKVTDYKTGQKSFDITALYHGLQLQLPVYLNAALESEQRKHPEKQIIPAGIFYYRIQDPVVPREGDDGKVEKSILRELRLDGLVNGSDEVIAHLERDLGSSSVLYPLGRNKDGSLSRSSKALNSNMFSTVLQYTKEKERRLKEEMYRGEAGAAPYELGEATGCDYCPFGDICGFDPRFEGYEYRKLERYSQSEAVMRMQEILKEADGKEDK